MNDVLDAATDPGPFPVVVLLRHKPANPATRWSRDSWQVTGVVANSQAPAERPRLIRSSAEGDDYLWGGLALRLYPDEVESYYYNLLAREPALYVICSKDDQGALQPLRVSASFDEANAYLGGEGDVASVPMPPEIYRWLERYVLIHYAPEPRRQRRRDNWAEPS